jgi:hypothetical protein
MCINQSINQVTYIAPQIREKISIQGRFYISNIAVAFKNRCVLRRLILTCLSIQPKRRLQVTKQKALEAERGGR